MRWGILSTARFVDRVLPHAEGRFVAVASRNADRARAWAAERGIAAAYGSYEELLADPQIDVVYIPLPNGLHAEWATRALQAGKHVLVEKPFTRRPEEVVHAFHVAQQHGLVLMEGLMWRHHPQVARALEAIGSGAIGAVRHVRVAFTFPLLRADDVRFQLGLDGGALMDVGCYCVSAARTFARAEPERVYGEPVYGPTGVDVAFAGTLRFPDRVLATFDCGMDRARRAEIEVVGETGTLRLPDPWHGADPVVELRTGDDEVQTLTVEHANPYSLELANLEAAARGEAEPLLGRDDALGQARALEALHRSAETGAPSDVV